MGEVKRRYHQTKRAERTAQTRQRIVEAAVELHSTVGPSHTSLSAVARQAGVSRPTVYAHFPDEIDLFQACTMYWMVQDPPPDPEAWTAVEDPRDRLATALTELFEHYGRNEEMLDNVLRDMHQVESMREFNAPLIERSFVRMMEALSSAFDDPPDVAVRREAMIALAIRFHTWKALARERGLTNDDAAELMTHAVITSGV